MIFQIKSYVKFLWDSKNAHGIHSPFVYELVTRCFYDKTEYPEYRLLNNYRKELLQNGNTIEVTDFGAGSKVFRSNKRVVSKIAQTAGITSENAELLFRIIRYFKPESLLEIGTSLGLATAALSLGNPSGKIVTLEGCPETSGVAKSQFEKSGLTNIEAIVTEFHQYLNQNLKPETQNLVYFDGNHSQKATLEYFELLLPGASQETIWIFDDIHWSPEMETAWETIRQNPKATVTIDTFQWGIVFFRKEQQKQHFVIRSRDSKGLHAFLGIRKLWGLLD